MPHSSFAACHASVQARGKPRLSGAPQEFCLREGFTSAPPPHELRGDPGGRPQNRQESLLVARGLEVYIQRSHDESPNYRLLSCSTWLSLEIRIRLDCGFQEHSNRTNPKRRPRKIRYA